MYQVILSNRAKKELKKLDKRIREKILKFLHLLENDALMGHKMSGNIGGKYKIKIPPLRIVYTPNYKNKTICVHALGFRGGVYKNL